jgi:hypothetical protein
MIRLIILISFIEAKENVPFVAGHFFMMIFYSDQSSSFFIVKLL